jgi:hypothetical protein
MTDKAKKRARELMAKTGMSYQAARNWLRTPPDQRPVLVLKPEPKKTEPPK